MARSQFETLANFLKAHPGTRPANTRRRGAHADRDHKPSPDLDRHRRKCKICRHPNRDEIERDYLRWRTSRDIARSFGITDHTVIFRHAWATGLYQQRQRIIAYALHPLLEQSEDIFIKATPNTIISAVQTYSQINNEGRRIRSKPVTNIYICDPQDESASRLTQNRPSRDIGTNPNIQELEDDSTH